MALSQLSELRLCLELGLLFNLRQPTSFFESPVSSCKKQPPFESVYFGSCFNFHCLNEPSLESCKVCLIILIVMKIKTGEIKSDAQGDNTVTAPDSKGCLLPGIIKPFS